MSGKDFQDHEKAQAAKLREQELAVHGDAVAGRFDTGRRTNRGFKDKHDREERQKKDRERHLDQAVKLSAEYLKLHNAVMNSLGGAETAVYDALIEAAQELATAKQHLSDIEDNAQTLPDGTKVFRSADGGVYTADGTRLDDDVAATIEWDDNAPSWEDHQAAKAAHDRAKERHKQLSKDNDRLAYIRGRMEDKDNPPTKEELERYQKEIDEITQHAKEEFTPSSEIEIEEPQDQPQAALPLDDYAPR